LKSSTASGTDIGPRHSITSSAMACTPGGNGAAIKKRDFGASQPAARKQSYISICDESMSDCGPERRLLGDSNTSGIGQSANGQREEKKCGDQTYRNPESRRRRHLSSSYFLRLNSNLAAAELRASDSAEPSRSIVSRSTLRPDIHPGS
jgi:hypothetical protein